jgi:hypothetical protein
MMNLHYSWRSLDELSNQSKCQFPFSVEWYALTLLQSNLLTSSTYCTALGHKAPGHWLIQTGTIRISASVLLVFIWLCLLLQFVSFLFFYIRVFFCQLLIVNSVDNHFLISFSVLLGVSLQPKVSAFTDLRMCYQIFASCSHCADINDNWNQSDDDGHRYAINFDSQFSHGHNSIHYKPIVKFQKVLI